MGANDFSLRYVRVCAKHDFPMWLVRPWRTTMLSGAACASSYRLHVELDQTIIQTSKSPKMSKLEKTIQRQQEKYRHVLSLPLRTSNKSVSESPKAHTTKLTSSCASSPPATLNNPTGPQPAPSFSLAHNPFYKQVKAAPAATFASSYSMYTTKARCSQMRRAKAGY
jgi:hypothetical protein